MITHEELLEFFGEDEPKEIARYMSMWINEIANGDVSIQEFIWMMRSEEVKNENMGS